MVAVTCFIIALFVIPAATGLGVIEYRAYKTRRLLKDIERDTVARKAPKRKRTNVKGKRRGDKTV